MLKMRYNFKLTCRIILFFTCLLQHLSGYGKDHARHGSFSPITRRKEKHVVSEIDMGQLKQVKGRHMYKS